MPIPHNILKFIRRHHVLTLATSGSEGLHCCHVFYAWEKEHNMLVFTSNPETLHARQALFDAEVAGGIVLETRSVAKVQGLQLTGRAMSVPEELAAAARKAYVRRFPYTAAADLKLWVFRPRTMKYTDNTLGFGEKVVWEAKEQQQ